MNSRYGRAAMLAAIFALTGCAKDSLIGPDDVMRLNGLVTDSQGNAIEGCGVHYIFSLTSSPLEKTGQTCPSTVIQFSIPTRSKVTLTVHRWYTLDLIATLVDDTLNSGTYSASADQASWTNGVYLYHLTINGETTEKSLLLLNSDVSVLVKTVPLATTDANGRFSLPYGMFGFGIPFARTSVYGPTLDTVYVSHAIQIVLTRPGYQTSVTSLTLNPAEEASQSFVLHPQ